VKRYLGLPKYHLGIIVLYALLIPVLFVLVPGAFRYNFTSNRLGMIAAIVAFTLVAFFYFLRSRKIEKPGLRPGRAASAILYGIAFALPEEIIFRGVIQGFFQAHLNTALAVLLSALIFGIAHLPNDRKLSLLAFLAGLPLGVIFALTNSLLIPTLLHALFVASLELFTRD